MKKNKNQNKRGRIFFACGIGFFLIFSAVFLFSEKVNAGDLSPTSSPVASSFTLSDIFNRLFSNQEATEGDHDLSTSASPVGTFHTLKEIYEAIPTIVANTVKAGTSYLGITGTLTPNGGTATEADVFNGKTAHLTEDWTLDSGTLNLACATATFNGTSNLVANAYDGAGDGTNRWCITDSGTANASQLLSGQTAWVDGQAINGTMTNVGAENFTPTTTDQTISEGYHDGTGEVEGDSDLMAENIKSGTEIFDITGSYSGYSGTGWQANESGDGSTALTEANCATASDWQWFEDGNGDGDTTDSEDGICVRTATVTSKSWNGDDDSEVRDNSYIASYQCEGNFPNGTVEAGTYRGVDDVDPQTFDTTWNDGDCALCQADCWDGKKDLPDNPLAEESHYLPGEGAASPNHEGPITPEVLKNWVGTRLPSSEDFFGFCGYKDGGSDYETSCSSDTTHGNYGQMVGRTDECLDLSNSAWEWLSEQHYHISARIAGDYACSYFGNCVVYGGYRFRAVFRP